MNEIIALIVGGSLGTITRYGVGRMLPVLDPGMMPWPTLIVNLLGSFTIGLLWGLLDVEQMSGTIKNLLFIGFLGSFTTFSTYSLDIMNLIRIGEYKMALFYFAVSNIAALMLVFMGFTIARLIKG